MIDAGRTIKATKAKVRESPRKSPRQCQRMETINEAPPDFFGSESAQAYYPLLEHITAAKDNPDGRIGGNKHRIMGYFRRMVEPITFNADVAPCDLGDPYWEYCQRLCILDLLLECENIASLHKLHLAAARLLVPLSDIPIYRDKAITSIVNAVFSGRIADATARKYMNQLTLTASEGGTAVAASIAEAASSYAKRNPEGHPRLKELINEHIARGVTALRRIGVPQDTWRQVLDSITYHDRNASYASERGTLTWSGPSSALKDYDSIGNATVITWNANGLRKAVRSGAFARFLDANTDADVININEAKCSPTSLPRVWEFRAAMQARGYQHMYWNWCSIEGRHGDWGCMVL